MIKTTKVKIHKNMDKMFFFTTFDTNLDMV